MFIRSKPKRGVTAYIIILRKGVYVGGIFRILWLNIHFGDHVYLRHLSTECRSILSADMATDTADISTDTRPICRPRLGRVSVDMNRQACRPTPDRYFTATRPPLGRHSAATWPPLGRHSAATRPILYQHSANTKLTWPALATAGVLSSLLYWERLSVAVVLFWPLTPAIFMYFFQLCFSSSSLLWTNLVTFGCSSIWGLLLLEARYFRGAKDDIKSWCDCALLLPHGWVFQF